MVPNEYSVPGTYIQYLLNSHLSPVRPPYLALRFGRSSVTSHVCVVPRLPTMIQAHHLIFESDTSTWQEFIPSPPNTHLD
jgi:hypothetical protein